MKNKLNYLGILILIVVFVGFYFISNYFLSKKKNTEVLPIEEQEEESLTYEEEINIISNLYSKSRILYDVVNNKFTVSQDDIIIINDITYKRITNFDTVMSDIFNYNGIYSYIETLGNYFTIYNGDYYLAGNLVTYQTYYFRGDKTNIYITNADNYQIDGIIYEKWTSNNKATLATIRAINNDGNWLIDDIKILYSDGINN